MTKAIVANPASARTNCRRSPVCRKREIARTMPDIPTTVPARLVMMLMITKGFIIIYLDFDAGDCTGAGLMMVPPQSDIAPFGNKYVWFA